MSLEEELGKRIEDNANEIVNIAQDLANGASDFQYDKTIGVDILSRWIEEDIKAIDWAIEDIEDTLERLKEKRELGI